MTMIKVLNELHEQLLVCEELLVLRLLIVHDGPHRLADGSHDELAESTRQHVGPGLLLDVERGVYPHIFTRLDHQIHLLCK